MGGADYSFILALASIVVTGIVWGVRLEGRINSHDTLFAEREKLTELRYETLRAEISLLRTAQGVVEAKIDRLIERP